MTIFFTGSRLKESKRPKQRKKRMDRRVKLLNEVI